MRRALLLLPLALAACADDKTGSQPSPPITVDASAPPPAGPRRTVGHRNPLGDAFQSDNLVLDGDFELTGRSDQAPWITFDPSQGQVTLNYDTGGHCRSGIRCATLAQPDALVGYFASPLTGKIDIKLYAKPSTQHCADLQVVAIDLMTNAEDAELLATSQAPAEDGWCLYAGEADNLAYEEPAIYVALGSNKTLTATIDEVSALPVGEAPVHGAFPPLVPIDAATKARIDVASAWIRGHRKYGVGEKARGPQ